MVPVSMVSTICHSPRNRRQIKHRGEISVEREEYQSCRSHLCSWADRCRGWLEFQCDECQRPSAFPEPPPPKASLGWHQQRTQIQPPHILFRSHCRGSGVCNSGCAGMRAVGFGGRWNWPLRRGRRCQDFQRQSRPGKRCQLTADYSRATAVHRRIRTIIVLVGNVLTVFSSHFPGQCWLE